MRRTRAYQNLSPLAGLFLLLLLCGLSGCAGLLDPGPPMSRVLLNPELPASSASSAVQPQQILVGQPNVADDLNTDRIAALFDGLEVRYLSRARWSGSVPDMLQRLMVDALENTGRFAGVGDETSGLTSQLRLSMDIKHFYLRYDAARQPVADVALALRLVDLKTGASLGFVRVEAQERAQSERIQDLTAAFDIATSRVLSKAGAWVIEQVAAL